MRRKFCVPSSIQLVIIECVVTLELVISKVGNQLLGDFAGVLRTEELKNKRTEEQFGLLFLFRGEKQ